MTADLTQFAGIAADATYEASADPAQLRAALVELGRFWQCLTQFTDVAAEMPGVLPQQIANVNTINTVVLSLLVQRINARLRVLEAARAPQVVVVDPQRCRMPAGGGNTMGLLPVLSRPNVATSAVSTAIQRLAAGTVHPPQSALDHDMIAVVLFGSVRLRWVDEDGASQHVLVRRHQHALVRRGTHWQLTNDGHVPTLLLIVRATADVTAGLAHVAELVDPHGAVCADLAG